MSGDLRTGTAARHEAGGRALPSRGRRPPAYRSLMAGISDMHYWRIAARHGRFRLTLGRRIRRQFKAHESLRSGRTARLPIISMNRENDMRISGDTSKYADGGELCQTYSGHFHIDGRLARCLNIRCASDDGRWAGDRYSDFRRSYRTADIYMFTPAGDILFSSASSATRAFAPYMRHLFRHIYRAHDASGQHAPGMRATGMREVS